MDPYRTPAQLPLPAPRPLGPAQVPVPEAFLPASTRAARWTAGVLLGLGHMLFAVLVACKPTPPQPPPPPPPVLLDGGHASPATACARLAAMGCPEADAGANGTTCEAVLQHALDEALVDIDLECITSAVDRTALHTCAGTHHTCE